MTLVALTLASMNGLLNIIGGKLIAALTIFPLLVIFSFVLVFNYYEKYKAAKNTFLIISTIFITNQFLLFGQSVHLHPYFLAIVAAVFLVHKSPKKRMYFLLFVACCYFISQFLPTLYVPPFEGKNNRFGKELHLALAGITVATITGLAMQEMEKYKNTLEKQSEILLRKNAELKEFAYIASHDLKTPLHNITNFLGLIDQQVKKEDYKDLPVFVGFAKDGSEKMIELINSLLIYSRIENIEETQKKEDLNVIFNEAKRNLRSLIQEKGAKIEKEDLPIYTVNKSLFLMLFQNLLENGLKYNESVEPKIEISCTKLSKHYEISFKDNGIGIEEEFQEKIFVMFQRLHNSNEYPGTGIGLAICKKIVEEHNGLIGIESEFGQGTIFKIKLPI